MIKNKLSQRSGSVAMRHLNPIHKNGPESLKVFLTLEVEIAVRYGAFIE